MWEHQHPLRQFGAALTPELLFKLEDRGLALEQLEVRFSSSDVLGANNLGTPDSIRQSLTASQAGGRPCPGAAGGNHMPDIQRYTCFVASHCRSFPIRSNRQTSRPARSRCELTPAAAALPDPQLPRRACLIMQLSSPASHAQLCLDSS